MEVLKNRQKRKKIAKEGIEPGGPNGTQKGWLTENTVQTLEMEDNVFVGVELVDAELGVNIIIEKAWATPIPSPYHSPVNIPIVDHR